MVVIGDFFVFVAFFSLSLVGGGGGGGFWSTCLCST